MPDEKLVLFADLKLLFSKNFRRFIRLMLLISLEKSSLQSCCHDNQNTEGKIFCTAVVNFNSFHFSPSLLYPAILGLFIVAWVFRQMRACLPSGWMMMMKPRENGRKLNYKQSVITNWPFLSTSLDAYVVIFNDPAL